MIVAPTPLAYLDAFPAPSHEAWRAAVDKVLKGGDFEKRLVGRSADGIRIEPLYPAAAPANRPRRGEIGRWHVVARLDHPEPDQARALALADLEGGADALSISFAGARAARGYGLIADTVAALDGALDGVMLDLIRLRLDPAPQGDINALLLADLVEKRGLAPETTAIDFGLDPIGVLASHGSLAVPWSEVGRQLAATITSLKQRGFAGPFITVDTRPYHDAGASEALELGTALATAVAYLRALEAQGMTMAAARDAISFVFVADTDEFLTVAKFRAARLLWDRVQTACSLEPKPMILHAETAWRSLTQRAPWVNLLRGTIAAFSAGVGGADSLTVLPFTAARGLPDAFARRIARNTQLILLEEANLWRVADPAAGAGGFEALTQALCGQGWKSFQEIEQQCAEGLRGIIAGLASDAIQKIVAAQWTARAKAVATRREPITGTSEFPDINEDAVTVLDIATVTPTTLSSQSSTAERKQDELIRSLVEGVRGTDALVADCGAFRVLPMPSLRLSEPFERLRDKADALPQLPIVFLATLGRIADFAARVAFARNLFEVGGLAAQIGDGFSADGATDFDALTRAFRASGAKLACLCGSDAAYASEGAAAAEELARAGATVWLAGHPADNDVTGVSSFIFMGCDVVDALERALVIMGSAGRQT